MRSVNAWLDTYAESHQHPTNKLLHWICVPSIVISLVGLLWSLPVPSAVAGLSPLLNWGTLLLASAALYYFTLSVPLALGMLPVMAGVLLVVLGLTALPVPLAMMSLAIFVVAWIGQFVGHRIEGRKPSFFQDLQFLLIGPLWILAAVYRRLGVAY